MVKNNFFSILAVFSVIRTYYSAIPVYRPLTRICICSGTSGSMVHTTVHISEMSVTKNNILLC